MHGDDRTRRSMLRLTGITATTALVAGCGGPGGEDEGEDEPEAEEGTGNGQDTDEETDNGQEDADEGDENGENGENGETDDDENGNGEADDEEFEAWEGVDEIILDGDTAAWMGVEPEPIAGEENPTLVLFEGEEYDITWENVDGEPHNIELWDEDEEPLEETELMDEEGEEQTLSFEATEEMVEYVCEVHVGTMRGDVQVETGE